MLLLAPTAHAKDFTDAEYEAAQKYITECSKDWANTVVTGDMSKRKVYFADDFQGTLPTGGRYDKAYMTTQEPLKDWVSNTVNNVDVRFFGPTAVAYGSETFKMKDGTTGTLVWTDIWHHRDGKWQVIAAQDVLEQKD